jgi:hypothetical protein
MTLSTRLKIAEVDEQKTKYLQHFINKHDIIVIKQRYTFHLHPLLHVMADCYVRVVVGGLLQGKIFIP